MKISSQIANYQLTKELPKNPSKKENASNTKQTQNKQVDEYIPSKEEKSVTYKKPTTKVDTNTIERLKAESEQAHAQLRDLVKRMLERQGIHIEDIKSGKAEFKVDDKARLEAQEAIGEGGALSPENVSDRIVDFAKAISGGDKSKFDLLKGAIEDGFKAAKDAFGGTLPEISQQTFDLAMEKLENWKDEE